MKRWLQPTLILALILSGAGVLLFPNLFVWKTRQPSPSVEGVRSAGIIRPAAVRPQSSRKLGAVHSVSRIRKLSRVKAETHLHPQQLPLKTTGATLATLRTAVRPKRNPTESAQLSRLNLPKHSTPVPQISATKAIKPLGYVQKEDGSVEAVISGPLGIQVVHQGETVGTKRVASISPESVELAEIQPASEPAAYTNPSATRQASASEAETETAKALTKRIAPTPAPSPKSVGYVELADGSRKSILLAGGGVNLAPEPPATDVSPEPGPTFAGLPGMKKPEAVSQLQHGIPAPEPHETIASSPAKQEPRTPPAQSQPEILAEAASNDISTAPDEGSSSSDPETASLSAAGKSVGFVKRANGQTLAIVARADGIRLIPGQTNAFGPELALNEVGLPSAGTSSSTDAEDRAPPDRSPPGKASALSKDFSHFAENPGASARGAPADARPWFLELPGMGVEDQAASADWRSPPSRNADSPAATSRRAAPEVSANAGDPNSGTQNVGYVEWGDGRKIDILNRNGEIQLIEKQKPAGMKQSAPSGQAASEFAEPASVLSLELHDFPTLPVAELPIAGDYPTELLGSAQPAGAPSGLPSIGIPENLESGQTLIGNPARLPGAVSQSSPSPISMRMASMSGQPTGPGGPLALGGILQTPTGSRLPLAQGP